MLGGNAGLNENNSDSTKQDRMGLDKLVKKRDRSNSSGRGRRGGRGERSGRTGRSERGDRGGVGGVGGSRRRSVSRRSRDDN